MTYSPFLKTPPTWLPLGGPADGDEAQTLAAEYPDLKVAGFEPNLELIRWQLANGWRDEWRMFPIGLSDREGKETLRVPTGPDGGRRGSIVRDVSGMKQTVTVRPLDDVVKTTGMPVENAILWLDIEGMESRALTGAVGLFRRKAITLVNVERRAGDDLTEILTAYGFVREHEWNHQRIHWDEIWVPAYRKIETENGRRTITEDAA